MTTSGSITSDDFAASTNDAAEGGSARSNMTPNEAVSSLLSEFSWNKWFIETFWPENEFRIRITMRDILAHKKPSASVFDVGCANGFMSYLFSQLGYRVTATDAADIPERPELLKRCGVAFFNSNLNDLDPFPTALDSTFDIALLGEVIEHILNHPCGLLKSIARTLKPDGILVLSTPNPATLMNAFRTISGRHSLWGTSTFIHHPKIRDGQIIDVGDVHYREYLASEIQDMLRNAGFESSEPVYFSSGSAHTQSTLKRAIKVIPGVHALGRTRILGASQYFVAKKKDS